MLLVPIYLSVFSHDFQVTCGKRFCRMTESIYATLVDFTFPPPPRRRWQNDFMCNERGENKTMRNYIYACVRGEYFPRHTKTKVRDLGGKQAINNYGLGFSYVFYGSNISFFKSAFQSCHQGTISLKNIESWHVAKKNGMRNKSPCNTSAPQIIWT